MKLKNPGLRFKGVCRTVFTDNHKYLSCQEPCTHILIDFHWYIKMLTLNKSENCNSHNFQGSQHFNPYFDLHRTSFCPCHPQQAFHTFSMIFSHPHVPARKYNNQIRNYRNARPKHPTAMPTPIFHVTCNTQVNRTTSRNNRWES